MYCVIKSSKKFYLNNDTDLENSDFQHVNKTRHFTVDQLVDAIAYAYDEDPEVALGELQDGCFTVEEIQKAINWFEFDTHY